jgi:hypothetical protein
VAIYVVSYDLNKQKNYPKLYDQIKSAGSTWCHPMDSTWLIVSNAGTVNVRDHIAKAMDQDDTILVSELVRGEWAAFNLAGPVAEWLNANA